MTAVISGIGLPGLKTNTRMSSVFPISSRHSTMVSKLYERRGTSRGSYKRGSDLDDGSAHELMYRTNWGTIIVARNYV